MDIQKCFNLNLHTHKYGFKNYLRGSVCGKCWWYSISQVPPAGWSVGASSEPFVHIPWPVILAESREH